MNENKLYELVEEFEHYEGYGGMFSSVSKEAAYRECAARLLEVLEGEGKPAKWWYLMDTVEGGLYWVKAFDENEASSKTGTWATGFTYTGIKVRGSSTGLPAELDEKRVKEWKENERRTCSDVR